MRLTSLDERVHVMDGAADAAQVVRAICESGAQEEAFYVLDVGDIVRKHTDWLAKMPRVKPHYAVKCNDSMTVIEVLAALGTGFDCASKAEINKVLEAGVDTSRIIFANPAKPASHIRHAAALGVDLMTFDNETELHKVKSLHPAAKLVLRIRCDAEVAQCQLGMKFGCDAADEAPALLQLAQDLGIDVVGVSFHVGSGCGDPPVFRRAIKAARVLFDLGTELGFNMRLLDLGGGYPGDKGTSIDKIADVVNSALADYFPSPDDVEVIAEPGRYYVASAYTLATCIHSKREVRPKGGGDVSHVMYYINDGVYGSFNCVLYDHAHPVPTTLNAPTGKLTPSSIWGPTCDGLDQVNADVMLPALLVGDWIIYENMGAYTLPVASTFNGFPVPKVHTVARESVALLLQELSPLSKDAFVSGNTPANLRLGLDIGGSGSIADWVPVCHSSDDQMSEGSVCDVDPQPWDVDVTATQTDSSFLFDYVQVGAVN